MTQQLHKGYKNADSKVHMFPNIYSSIIYNGQIRETTQMSTDWWMDKEDVVYIYDGVLLGNQK